MIMNDSDENCKKMLPSPTSGVALQSILVDESVSDNQIDMIDDADPALKQNDQIKINTARGRKKGTKNCPKDERRIKIDPRVSYLSGQKPRSKSQSGKNIRNSSKDLTIERKR